MSRGLGDVYKRQVYRYPKAQALKVAVDTIRDFLLENDMTVYVVLFDKELNETGTTLSKN